MPQIDRRALSLLGVAAMLPPHFAFAEGAYPSRPIHVIVGFTPGAAADITARVLGESMGPILGQQMVRREQAGCGIKHRRRVCGPRGQGRLHAVSCNVVDHRRPDYQSQSVL